MSFFRKSPIYIIIFFIFILDFVITQIFGNKINDILYGKYDTNNKIAYTNRIDVHHNLKPNQNLIRKWHKPYLHITDENGLRTGNCSKYQPEKKNIFIVGDSMVESIGVDYEKTFIGLLNCDTEIKMNILNLGVASNSPILYYEKIKQISSHIGPPFAIFVFLAVNDIQDDFKYIRIKNRIYDSSEKNLFSKDVAIGYIINDIKFFLKNNFQIFHFIDLIKDKYEKKRRKGKVTQFNKTDKDLYKIGIDHPKTLWTIKKDLYIKYGRKGLKKSEENLNRIYELAEKNNSEIYLVIWPAPDQIYYNDMDSIHIKYWNNWVRNKSVKLIDLNKYFFVEDKVKTIQKYFFPDDTHWNEEGHKLIYEKIFEEIKKINF